jgi:hypothetical protein
VALDDLTVRLSSNSCDMTRCDRGGCEHGRVQRAAAPRYFVNGPVDAFVMGGLSITVFALLRFVPGTTITNAVTTIGPLLVWGISYPHFVSTSHRLYGSRANLRQYPMTALLTPLIFAAAIVASFVSPNNVAPAFVKLFQLWSPYHFSGQTLGLTLLYARRCGFDVDREMRRALTAFIYLTFVYGSARSEVGVHARRFLGVTYPSLDLPSWLPTLLAVATWMSAVVVGALLLRRRRSGRDGIPLIVLLPAVTQCVWFATAPIPVYFGLVFFFHSLQYLFVSWNLQLRLSLDASTVGPSRRFVLRESARWMAFNVAGGYLFFWFLPRVASHFGRPQAFATAIVLVAIQTHHFFVDGVIWRLRSAGLQSPLASSLGELTGRAPAAVAS